MSQQTGHTVRSGHPSSLWITWEAHRRTQEMAVALGIPLVEYDRPNLGWARYPFLLFATLRTLLAHRPDTLIVQCPSIILGVWVGLLRPVLRYRLVADCHNGAVLPWCYQFGLYRALVRFIHRTADVCWVTNARLVEVVLKNGGRSLVLPDRVPSLHSPVPTNVAPGARVTETQPSIVFICSYASDEPYAAVIEAARTLGAGVEWEITGNMKRADPHLVRNLPPQVRLTGYLSEPDYVALLAHADVLVDLTLMDDCLLCGAYEAVALGKPLVTSDTQALRDYFRQGAVYTKPDAASIAAAVLDALTRRAALASEMEAFRPVLMQEWRLQRDLVMDDLNRRSATAGAQK